MTADSLSMPSPDNPNEILNDIADYADINLSILKDIVDYIRETEYDNFVDYIREGNDAGDHIYALSFKVTGKYDELNEVVADILTDDD